MHTLDSSAHGRPAGGAEQNDTVVIGLTPDPSDQETRGTSRELGLRPEMTYGCVEWFDYRSHPLGAAVGQERKLPAAASDVPEKSAHAATEQSNVP